MLVQVRETDERIQNHASHLGPFGQLLANPLVQRTMFIPRHQHVESVSTIALKEAHNFDNRVVLVPVYNDRLFQARAQAICLLDYILLDRKPTVAIVNLSCANRMSRRSFPSSSSVGTSSLPNTFAKACM